ncbi:alpha/beta hydrolase [Geodermatophilus sp. URMC 64]
MTYDPEIAAALMAQAAAAATIALPARDDVDGLRRLTDLALAQSSDELPDAPDVVMTPDTVEADDGTDVPVRWYTHTDPLPGPAVVYVHGGGMICGSLDNYDRRVRHYAQLTRVPFLAVGYRLAPEFPGEIPARDAYAAVRSLTKGAPRWGVDPDRIALMGDSGGGGVAAGAAILARDEGVQVARQILIYPMLDDRNTEPDPLLAAGATWTYDHNYTGWHAMLGDDLGEPSVSPIAAPARLTDFCGLAPAYIEVGELDIFRDECLAYAQRLLAASVSCELHVHPGTPHAPDLLAPDAAVSRRAVADRLRVIASL